jgi:hypothetical protein
VSGCFHRAPLEHGAAGRWLLRLGGSFNSKLAIDGISIDAPISSQGFVADVAPLAE